MSRAIAGFAALAVLCVGCSTRPITEPVKIVAVHCEKRTGESDCRTVIEFNDRTRQRVVGVWGQVGDEFFWDKGRY